MAVTLKWLSKHCVIKHSGVAYIDDALDTYEKIVGNSSFDTIDFMVVDCRKLIDVQYKESDFDTHAAISQSSAKIRRKNLKVAVIVSNKESEQAVKLIITTSKSFPHNWTRKIFWDYDEAINWAQSPNSY